MDETIEQLAKRLDVPVDLSMQDGFGRQIDEDQYWQNTGLSAASIARVKESKRKKANGTEA